jgi:hypothetical protein
MSKNYEIVESGRIIGNFESWWIYSSTLVSFEDMTLFLKFDLTVQKFFFSKI